MWELEGIAGQHGEAEIVTRIRTGLPAATRARPAGAEKWRPVGAHEPFAAALDAARPSVQRAQAIGFVAALLVLAIAAGGWFLVGGRLILAKGADGNSERERTWIVLP